MAVEPSASLITPHESGLAERVAVVETKLEGMDDRLVSMDEKLDKALAHDEKACTAWKALTALFVALKWTVIIVGGLLGIITALRELGAFG